MFGPQAIHVASPVGNHCMQPALVLKLVNTFAQSRHCLSFQAIVYLNPQCGQIVPVVGILLLHLLDMPLQDLTKHLLDLLLATHSGANNNNTLSMQISLRVLLIVQAQRAPTCLLQ